MEEELKRRKFICLPPHLSSHTTELKAQEVQITTAKLTQEKSISQKADIGCVLLSPLIFVREFLLQVTPHTRDIAVQHCPTEHYLSLFFVFKDTLAMIFLFLSKSLARSPKM